MKLIQAPIAGRRFSRPYAELLVVLLLSFGAGRLWAEETALSPWFSEAEQAAFGLDDLAAPEQAALAAWLAERLGRGSKVVEPKGPEAATVAGAVSEAETAATTSQVDPVETAGAASDFGREQVPEPKDKVERELGQRIQARIKGPFTGWDGKTLFRLDNGQVWRQRIGGRYRYRAESPQVEIVKGRFGYYLEVVETGRQIGVRRVR